jgi:hypothetical protein
MALVAVASVRGAPGVTTAALGLASCWPDRAVLAELDPDGGDLRYRLRDGGGAPLAAAPGLVEWAVPAGEAEGPDLLDCVQHLGNGLPLLVGVSSAAQVRALAGRWGEVGERLAAAPGIDVVADCGRLHTSSPVVAALPHAAALLLLVRPTIDEVSHLRAYLEAAPRRPATYVAVVSGATDKRTFAEVRAALADAGGSTVLGRVAYDPPTAATLAGQWSGKVTGSPLFASVRDLGRRLAAVLDDMEDPGDTEDAGPVPAAPVGAPQWR